MQANQSTGCSPQTQPASPQVLVTGAGGFIGSHLAEACAARGWQVQAMVRYNSHNRSAGSKNPRCAMACKSCREMCATSIRCWALGDLAQKIAGLLGRSIEVQTASERVRPGSSEVERLLCDSRRMQSLTAWRPAYDLERGLRETIEWVRTHQDSFHSHSYVL